jgi:2-phosphosulfolactate phosphatase
VAGKTIVMTTTNGTRALRACAGAKQVLATSFLNLSATASHLMKTSPPHLILICSGTHEEPALEDILAAGALSQRLWNRYAAGQISDAAELARNTFETIGKDLPSAMARARNGKRLLALPDLKDDVAECLRLDAFPFCAALDSNGAVRRLN